MSTKRSINITCILIVLKKIKQNQTLYVRMTCPDKRNIENEKRRKPLPYNYNDMMVEFQVISFGLCPKVVLESLCVCG